MTDAAQWHPSPYLVWQQEREQSFFPLEGSGCWTVGRHQDNDVVLPDPWISRHHALLQCMENGDMYLIDLGSRNGSYLNGRRVGIPVTLQHGDRITFGQSEVTFYALPEDIDPSDGALDETAFPAKLGTRQLISVLVFDVCDFASISHQLDEGELCEVMGLWFNRCGSVLRQHGSWLEQNFGEPGVAVWIHREASIDADEAENILSALNALQHVAEELAGRYKLPVTLRFGAGLSTGYGIVGLLQHGDRLDYAALGETANVAALLESVTEQTGWDMVFSPSSYTFLSPWVRSPAAGKEDIFQPCAVKGDGKETIAYGTSFASLQACLATRKRPSGAEKH